VVLRQYERARQWIREHAGQTALLLSEEAKVPLDVSQLQLTRTDFSTALPADVHRAALKSAAPVLAAEGLVKSGVDVAGVIDRLVVSELARRAGVA
jgi:sulfonate transport system substrate-binding protein